MKIAGRSPQAIEDALDGRDFLLEINRYEFLKAANQRFVWAKQDQDRRDEELRKEKEKIESLKLLWGADNMIQFMEKYSREHIGKEMIINDSNSKLRLALCYFVSRDLRFNTELGYNTKKGLMIRGNTGVGKTYMVKCIATNEYNPIRIHSMLSINNEIKNSEFGDYNMKYARIHYIDDVGTTTPIINHFGTKINWFKDFIELESFEKNNFSHLIISTNCSFDEIEAMYGFRVRSRMAEMFNVIDVEGEDFRKS